MKLTKKISTSHFILSHLLILFTGLTFLAGLFYILNIQYQKPKGLFQNGLVTSARKSLVLNLEQPDQDSLSYSSSIVVSGKTKPGKEVLISTETNDLVIKARQDGSFSTILNLNEGVNTITTVVFDTTGDSRLAKRVVYYSKEKL